MDACGSFVEVKKHTFLLFPAFARPKSSSLYVQTCAEKIRESEVDPEWKKGTERQRGCVSNADPSPPLHSFGAVWPKP